MKICRPVLAIAAALLLLALLAPISLAQTGKLYRVGLLSSGSFAPSTNAGRMTDELVQHLAQSGFTSGVNLEVVKRGAEGHYERLPGLLAEMVAAKVDVIVTFSYPAAAAAKESTSTVPIVTFGTGDPVKTHLVVSLNRPGGNITGISDVAGELAPKRLELLKEAAPQLQSVAMLWNAQDLGMTMPLRGLGGCGEAIGRQCTVIWRARAE